MRDRLEKVSVKLRDKLICCPDCLVASSVSPNLPIKEGSIARMIATRLQQAVRNYSLDAPLAEKEKNKSLGENSRDDGDDDGGADRVCQFVLDVRPVEVVVSASPVSRRSRRRTTMNSARMTKPHRMRPSPTKMTMMMLPARPTRRCRRGHAVVVGWWAELNAVLQPPQP